jgi:hypothetical protein
VRQLDASEKEEVFDCAMAWHGMLLFSCRLCKNVEGPADAGGMYWTKDFDFE